MLEPPYALWSIWRNLSVLQRGFVLVLGAVTIYSLFSAATIMLRLHSMRNSLCEGITVGRASVTKLIKRWANVRELIAVTFYIFGLILFIGLQFVFRTLGDSKGLLGREVIGNFVLHFAFAANVFFIFLVLQLIHWAIDAALNAVSQTVGI